MDQNAISQWFTRLPLSIKIRALALIYSKLTTNSRELFMPEHTAGREKRVSEILHGLNEIHHTLANWLVAYVTDDKEAFPPHILAEQLVEIEKRYHLERILTPAIESVRTYLAETPPISAPSGEGKKN